MTIQIKPLEESAENWARGCDREIRETLTSSDSHARVARAVSFLTGNVRVLSRRSGTTAQITVPSFVLDHLGVKPGDYVVFEKVGPAGALFRKLTPAEFEEFAGERAARASQLLRPPAWTRPAIRREKNCEQCGELYEAHRAFQKFCPPCSEARNKASKRAYWQAQRKERARAVEVLTREVVTSGRSIDTVGKRAEDNAAGRPGGLNTESPLNRADADTPGTV